MLWCVYFNAVKEHQNFTLKTSTWKSTWFNVNNTYNFYLDSRYLYIGSKNFHQFVCSYSVKNSHSGFFVLRYLKSQLKSNTHKLKNYIKITPKKLEYNLQNWNIITVIINFNSYFYSISKSNYDVYVQIKNT